MAGKDITVGNHGWKGQTVKKYVVPLSAEEREQLQALVRKGKARARRLLKARILLKADVSEGGFQQSVEFRRPSPELRPRLHGPLVFERRLS
jgi:hypothetical protein